MKAVIIIVAMLAYLLALLILTCYMVVNHGWYWIFLLLFCNIKYSDS